MRLIDADALKHEFNICFGGVSHAVAANAIIDNAPTVGVKCVAGLPTKDIVSALVGRDGVDTAEVYPHDTMDLRVDGPAIVLVVTD